MLNRRSFMASLPLLTGALADAQSSTPPSSTPQKPRHKVERLGIGAIGLRYQGSVITEKARAHGDIVALADVDRHVREQARAAFGSKSQIFEDYRQLLQRKDVDVILIATPDHWHTKMLIDALRAGKDVYCEKPLTLTIDEGKQIRTAAAQSKSIVQVGSWQRSDHHFRTAVELVRQGRLGDLQRVDVVLGKNDVGGPFETYPVPRHFNWNLWQGQTPDVPYIPERAHYTFRWWHEYSGGQLTDWGAHHVDIAHWAINSNPAEISGSAKYPHTLNGFNVPIDFDLQYRFANGVLMTVTDHGRNGIMFTGSQGRIFVNRDSVSGRPVQDLAHNPLPREKFSLYNFDNLERPPRTGKLDAIINHMGNFFDCIATRRTPLSDLESQHRSISACHLGNIALKLGRSVKWDGEKEEFPGDPTANALLKRDQRPGFETA